MRDPNEWGNETTLFVLSRYLSQPIFVYIYNLRFAAEIYGWNNFKGKEPVYLSFERGNHYNWLRSKKTLKV